VELPATRPLPFAVFKTGAINRSATSPGFAGAAGLATATGFFGLTQLVMARAIQIEARRAEIYQ